MDLRKKEIEFKESDWKRLFEWMLKEDHGTSSETIACVNLGIQYDRSDAPYDLSDFIRCVKLLRIFPFFKDNLEYLSNIKPKFAFWVKNWDYLEDLVNKIEGLNLEIEQEYDIFKKQKENRPILVEFEFDKMYDIYQAKINAIIEKKQKLVEKFDEFIENVTMNGKPFM